MYELYLDGALMRGFESLTEVLKYIEHEWIEEGGLAFDTDGSGCYDFNSIEIKRT
jgi:hypothetical protein